MTEPKPCRALQTGEHVRLASLGHHHLRVRQELPQDDQPRYAVSHDGGRVSIRLWVPGEPRGKGSTQAFASKSTGRMVYRPMAKGLKAWESSIAGTARDAVGRGGWVRSGRALWDRYTPVTLVVAFHVHPPARLPVGRSSTWPTVMPDLDKLGRAVLDALTGVLYVDDAQVVQLTLEKVHADRSGPEGVVIAARQARP